MGRTQREPKHLIQRLHYFRKGGREIALKETTGTTFGNALTPVMLLERTTVKLLVN